MSEMPAWLVFCLGLVAGVALGVVLCLVVVLLEDAHRWGPGGAA